MNARLSKREIDCLATRYAESYGIILYRVEGLWLIYNKSYRQYLNNPRHTIQHRVHLLTGEHTSTMLQRYDTKAEVNGY